MIAEIQFTPEFMNKLRWRCRRGMQELDLLLIAYIDNEFEAADPAIQQAFLDILGMQDPEIFHLLTGRSTSDDENIQSVINALIAIHN